MKNFTRIGIFVAFCALQAVGAEAGPLQCSTWNGTGYCQYDGKVSRAYINAYKEVILYFDTAFSTSVPTGVGINGVTINNAAKFNMTANPDFGKSLFAALLAAQARGATISVQFNGVVDGYLAIDRIWVNE
jgi:hypothetical protein